MVKRFKSFFMLCLLVLTMNSFALSGGGCAGTCENTYYTEYSEAWNTYFTCTLDPPQPGGQQECYDNLQNSLAQAEINRLNCLAACQGGGTGSNPNNVLIISSDLVKLNQENTSSGLVELKILSEESDYQQFSLQTTVPIASSPIGSWDFGFGIENIRNRRPDLFCIKKTGTSSGYVEVTILSGQSDYQSVITSRVTPIPVSNDDWEFIVGAPNTNLDPTMFNVQNPPFQIGGRIIAIQKNGTQSGNTEIFILEYGVNTYEVMSSAVLPLSETDKNWRFSTGDWDQDGTADLMAIHMQKTGSGYVEVTVFSGADSYSPIIETTVPFETNSDWDFFATQYFGLGDEEPEFFGIDKYGSNGDILINMNWDAFSGYPNSYWQNLISPLSQDTNSVFFPAPSYDCSNCPD